MRDAEDSVSQQSDRAGQAWRVTFMHRCRGAIETTFVVVSSDRRRLDDGQIAVHDVLVTSDGERDGHSNMSVEQWHESTAVPWESIGHFARLA